MNILRKPDVGKGIAGAFAVVLLVLLTIFIRAPEFNHPTGSQNLEAPYHVLLTVRALGESSIRNHWLLPTVTLGAEADKHIPWGGTIPTATGDYVYTSFMPAGFLFPYAVFSALGVQPSIAALAYLNAILGGISATLLFFLSLRIIRSSGVVALPAVVGALAATTVGIFSREALHSTGVSYWCQCLYQPVLILSIITFLRIWQREGNTRVAGAWLVLLALLGPMIEWTGYAFNGGLVLVALATRMPGWRALSLKVILATVLAGTITLVHFSLAAGLMPALKAFAARFLARSPATGDLVSLLQGYSLSYGMFLIVLMGLLAFLVVSPSANRSDGPASPALQAGAQCVTIALVLSLVACFENLLMLQHATEFTFDRLKFAVPAALLFAFGFVRLGAVMRVVLVFALVIASAHGVKSYKRGFREYAPWAAMDVANHQLAGVVARNHRGCSVLSSNINVRGYANLLFGHGIYEKKSRGDAPELIGEKGACQNLFIEGWFPYPDMPEYYRLSRVDRDGQYEVLWEKKE